MGLGRFGGGVGVARFLVGKGAKVLVTDKDPESELAESVAKLHGLPVEFRLGEHRVEDFTAADIVVVNPAVNPNNLYVNAARKAGVALTSEIRLLISHLPNRLRTIGITGSAGKSTTTAMIGHILQHAIDQQTIAAPRVWVGGNIGGSLLADLDRISKDDWVVLELSSFMLEGIREDRWSPHIAVLTNFSANHLDWHGTIDAYRSAKRVLFEFQQPGDVAIFCKEFGEMFALPIEGGATRHVSFDDGDKDQLDDDVQLLIPGEHNRVNATFALAVTVDHAGVPRSVAHDALSNFAGLEHRLQFVCEHAGVRYFNDSKATTPEAAILAMESFPQGRVHVLLGGYDKKSDLTSMAQVASRHCRAIYTLGVTGEAIARAAEHASEQCNVTGSRQMPNSCGGTAESDGLPASVIRCGTLDEALKQTTHRIRRGDVVLLSPGCASWDQYEHFEKRGHAFIEAILKYTGEDAPSPGH